jgi:hypothetical protein
MAKILCVFHDDPTTGYPPIYSRSDIPKIATDGGWNIADCVSRSYDLEGMHVGTVAAGRIGLAILLRLDVRLHYTQRHPLPRQIEEELDLTYHRTAQEMVKVFDVVTINAPLYPGTKGLFNEGLLKSMKRGSYLETLRVRRFVNVMRSFETWKKAAWLAMREMFGSLSPHHLIIHGEECLTKE